MITIFHNPRCKKSREGLEYLRSRTNRFIVREYLSELLTDTELDEILLKSGLQPPDLVRQQEEIYRRELKGRNFTNEEWKQIILENPKLLIRPIVVGRYRAVHAQPAERIEEVLKH